MARSVAACGGTRTGTGVQAGPVAVLQPSQQRFQRGDVAGGTSGGFLQGLQAGPFRPESSADTVAVPVVVGGARRDAARARILSAPVAAAAAETRSPTGMPDEFRAAVEAGCRGRHACIIYLRERLIEIARRKGRSQGGIADPGVGVAGLGVAFSAMLSGEHRAGDPVAVPACQFRGPAGNSVWPGMENRRKGVR